MRLEPYLLGSLQLSPGPIAGLRENKYESYYGPGRRPLAYLYADGKPRLFIYSHHCAPPLIVLQQAAARYTAGCYMHCAGSILVKVQCKVLNR